MTTNSDTKTTCMIYVKLVFIYLHFALVHHDLAIALGLPEKEIQYIFMSYVNKNIYY